MLTMQIQLANSLKIESLMSTPYGNFHPDVLNFEENPLEGFETSTFHLPKTMPAKVNYDRISKYFCTVLEKVFKIA